MTLEFIALNVAMSPIDPWDGECWVHTGSFVWTLYELLTRCGGTF